MSSLSRNVTQYKVVTDEAVADWLTLADKTDMFVRNVGNQLPTYAT
jgi:hypothetical protein